MMAKVARHRTTRRIAALGPDHDGFDPNLDMATYEYSMEDYDTALAEWFSYPQPVPPRQAAKTAIQSYLDGTLTARDALAAIKEAL